MNTIAFALVAVLAALTPPLPHADGQDTSIPDEVRRRIDHREGTWAIEMDLYDEHGGIARTVTGTDVATRIGRGPVLDIETVFPDLGDHSKAWMFFDPADQRFKNMSVDAKGNYWLLSGDLDAFVIASAARPTADGGSLVLRFTHEDIEPDSFVARGEFSFDGGKTYRPMSRQRFRRQSPRAPTANAPMQDPALDNLRHPPGYLTGLPRRLGSVVKHGTGPVDMILVPGLGFSGAVFETFMRDHADRFTMYAVTLPGFGGSPAPPMPPDGTSYAEQTWIRGAAGAVADLIRREGLTRPVILGHMDMGTQIAVRLARDHAALVGPLVLVAGEPARVPGPTLPPDATAEVRRRYVDEGLAPPWFKTVTKATWDQNMWSPATYARDAEAAQSLWDEVARVPLAVMIRYLCEMYAYDINADLQAMTTPAIVVRPGFHAGYTDGFSDAARRFHQASWAPFAGHAAITFVTVPDAQLFIMLDAPDALDRIITEFLAAQGAR